jgi:hypothetical protein
MLDDGLDWEGPWNHFYFRILSLHRHLIPIYRTKEYRTLRGVDDLEKVAPMVTTELRLIVV